MNSLPPHVWISLQRLGMNSYRMPTKEDLKTQYRQLALQHHPDRGGNAEKMKTINSAYKSVERWITKG